MRKGAAMKRYVQYCLRCEKEAADDGYACPVCGGPLGQRYDLSDAEFFRNVLRNARRFWDYAPFFAVREPERAITLGEGFTPLVRSDRAGEQLGVGRLHVKNEAANPSGTFKDRCMSISVSRAREDGDAAFVIGSAGNAGAAAAAYAARAGKPCYVLLPASTPKERLAQIQVCGARLILVEGSVTDCIELIRSVAPEQGWRNLTTAAAYNPYQADAEKAIAYEMAQAMAWHVPDWVVTPIGGGGILTGIYNGYADLLALGLTDRMPKMIGVQETGCAPLVDAFKQGLGPDAIPTVAAPTGIAVAIADAYPLDGPTALQAIRTSGGVAEDVSSEEIVAAQRLLASAEGIYAEPASSTTIAGVAKLRAIGTIGAQDEVVCVITGSGMKEMGLTARYLDSSPKIPLDADALRRVVDTP